MSVIVGVVAEDGVYMGCDGRATFGYYQAPQICPKMERVGPMLIGVSAMEAAAEMLPSVGPPFWIEKL